MPGHFNFTKIKKAAFLSKIDGPLTKQAADVLHLDHIIFIKAVMADATNEALINRRRRVTNADIKNAIRRQLQKFQG